MDTMESLKILWVAILFIITFVTLATWEQYQDRKEMARIMEFRKIKIKYFSDKIDKIEKILNGNWIDLRAAEEIELKAGEFKLIPLGIGMKLPDGYEANIVPRSSTFKNYGILQTNHFAVIDNSYSGDNDQWFYPVYATRDVTIHINDRICQFRLNKIQSDFTFEEVTCLDEVNRGGFGSTGRK